MRDCEQANILLLRQNLERFGLERRREYDFGEYVSNLARHVGGHGPVRGDNTAERRNGITLVCAAVRLSDIGSDSNTARVGVLDYRDSRRVMVIGRAQCCITVNIVVERHFLAVQLNCTGDSAGFFFTVKRRTLMRVFAVAQHVFTLPDSTGETREGDGRISGSGVVLNLVFYLIREPGRNRQVIAGGVLKSSGRERTTLSEGKALTGCGSNNIAVTRRVNYNRY